MYEPVDKGVQVLAKAKDWFKATQSGATMGCVEVRFDADRVWIRDSKYRRDPANDPANEPIIGLSISAWLGYLDELSGTADAGANGELDVTSDASGTVTFTSIGDGTSLVYFDYEIMAFLQGVEAGEFTPELVASGRV